MIALNVVGSSLDTMMLWGPMLECKTTIGTSSTIGEILCRRVRTKLPILLTYFFLNSSMPCCFSRARNEAFTWDSRYSFTEGNGPPKPWWRSA
uniref:Uncharacterized protein n=1 Tax=Bionectria ochroleuca TaxID=29856 RepID=A0A0B7K0P0_BIOOC